MVTTPDDTLTPSHDRAGDTAQTNAHGNKTAITYPSLFHRADKYAIREQRGYYIGLFFQLLFSFLVTVLSIYMVQSTSHAILQTIFLLLVCILSIYLFFSKRVDRWYAARACAESVKTRSWRFMMKAEPYQLGDEEALKLFTRDLEATLTDQAPLLSRLMPDLERENLADPSFTAMTEVRNYTTQQRSDLFYQERISDQHNWYCAKSRKKGVQSNLFSVLFLVFVVIALGVSISRIIEPSNPVWPIDAVVCIAMAVLTWIQAKKFSELKSSYRQASQETKRILNTWPQAPSEQELASLVADVESTFSGEHTQWTARKVS